MMNKIIIVCIICFSVAIAAQAQSPLENSLRNLSISNYLNKPIDTLIAHLPAGYDTVFEVAPAQNINRGASLQINYPPDNQYWILINITDAQYITVDKDTRGIPYEVAWPIALLRKEKVAGVRIFTGAYEIINQADIY